MKYDYTKIYLTATIFIPGKTPAFKKYTHNIKNTDRQVSKFCADMYKRWPAAKYINFYYKHSGLFKERIYFFN